jgi:hypothetical protein
LVLRTLLALLSQKLISLSFKGVFQGDLTMVLGWATNDFPGLTWLAKLVKPLSKEALL